MHGSNDTDLENTILNDVLKTFLFQWFKVCYVLMFLNLKQCFNLWITKHIIIYSPVA